ncbi:MAG: AAA family ATPase [Chitinophagaceae bacterium]|nr:AAA family ATPase [Chitinophagaceae bacterium]
MIFINSLSINTSKEHPFPYSIPAIKFANNINTNFAVTIFVGDNGTGKSTLLETIGATINLPLIDGYNYNPQAGFEAALKLKKDVHIEWSRKTSSGFFFRAEDFSDFINGVEQARNRIAADLHELKGEVDDAIIEQMSNSMNFQLHNMRKNYGDDMQAYSHGEAYLKILYSRIQGKGIYLLDEPEAALSPLKQLSLISFILETVKTEQAQFFIATHSPLLMGIPGACIYEINEEEMRKVAYEDTEHYLITKNFLNNREVYLKHL